MGPTSGPQVTFIYGCPELGGNAISSQMQPSDLTLQAHSPRIHLEIVRLPQRQSDTLPSLQESGVWDSQLSWPKESPHESFPVLNNLPFPYPALCWEGRGSKSCELVFTGPSDSALSWYMPHFIIP